MFTVVLLLVLAGIGGAIVVWSMSWQSAWPGAGADAADGDESAPWEPGTAEGETGTDVAPQSKRRRNRRRAAAARRGATQDGVPAAVAIMEHGEPYAPPSVLSRLWAMLRLVLVVAVACALIAGAIYYVANSISKLAGHGGG